MAIREKIRVAYPFTDLPGRGPHNLIERYTFSDEDERELFLRNPVEFLKTPRKTLDLRHHDFLDRLRPAPIKFLPDIRGIKSGRGATSMGMDQSGMFFGGDTFASGLVKLLMTGKLVTTYHDYAGGTTGGPDADADAEDGMLIIGKDYGAVGTHKLITLVGGAVKSVTLS